MAHREEHGLALAEGPLTTYNLGERFLIYSGSKAKGTSGYWLYEGETLRGDKLLKKGDKVVVKEILLKPIQDGQTRELPTAIRKQLHREIVLQAQIRHRNLVRVHYSCITPSKLFIIRDRIEGDTLADICAQRPNESPALSFHEAGSYFNQLVSAVSFLHSRRPTVCHRGLTSDNCIIDKSGCLKIQDFGLAIVAQEGMCVTLCGSPLFWPPEMVANEVGKPTNPYNGAAMDVWSMGMILHCMLAGKVPQDMKKNTKDGKPIVVLSLDDIHPEDERMDAESAKDLIKRMLDPNPITRITIEGVVKHLRERPWCDIPYEEPRDSTIVDWDPNTHMDLPFEPMPGPYVPLSLFELVGTWNPVWMAQDPASPIRQTGDLTDNPIDTKLSKYQVWRRLCEWEDVTKIGPCGNLGIRLKLRKWEGVKIQVRMCEVFVKREVKTLLSVIVMSKTHTSKTSWEDFRKIASEIGHWLKCDKISRAIDAGNRFEMVWSGEHPEVDEEEK